MTPLEESIQKTLSYFDIFDYPLTKEELFAYLWHSPSISYQQFIDEIEKKEFNKIDKKFGYYFLIGREDIVEKRRQAFLNGSKKIKIANRAARKLRTVPFLKAIFICNSIGAGVSKVDSDIDFFIITSAGKIWLVRFLTNFILKFWRLRTFTGNSKNKICLSFYIDENHLDIKQLRAVDEDIYLIYWIHQLIPIFDPENIYDKFLSANKWSENFVANAKRKSGSNYLGAITDTKFSVFWKNTWEKIWSGGYGDMIETKSKNLQMDRLKISKHNLLYRNDNSVVISDGILKFHTKDPRVDLWNKWKKKISE